MTSISILTLVTWLILGLRGEIPSSLMREYENNIALISFTFSLAVWVSACPCGKFIDKHTGRVVVSITSYFFLEAFGLAAPTAVMVSTGLAAKYGILIRRGAAIQKAASVSVVAFDKTGTLTEGKTAVSDFDLILHDDSSANKISKCNLSARADAEEVSSYCIRKTCTIHSLLKAGVKQDFGHIDEQLLGNTFSLLMKAEVRKS